MTPLASIIIPNWNGRQHLAVCLQALSKQTFRDFEILLVDNGSTDDSVAFVKEIFPETIVIELAQNEGFTGACNAGYQAARGEYILLLNNDTEADPEWLDKLVHAFDRYPQAGILASKIMLFDQRDRLHSAGDSYRIDGIPVNRGVWQEDVGQYEMEEPVFSACGAAAAYRRAMIAEIGFLDDRFYFSCEDVDLGWRAHLAGWQVTYIPEAIVYHKLKATGGSVTGSYYDGRNFLYLIWKNYPGPLLRQYWPVIVKAQLNITLTALRSWRGAAARARIRGQIAGFFRLFSLLSARRQLQANRRITDESLTELMTPVD